MGSSGGGDDGAGMMAMMQQGTPMPGLPIAGQGGGVNPREYGQFQNFLPEPLAEGQNPMATGLRPDMLKFRSPNGVMDESSGGGSGGGTSGEIEALRGELAKLTAGLGQGVAPDGTGGSGGSSATAGGAVNGNFMGGGGGGIGTMGMGGNRSSAFLPDGKTPVPMQGRMGGTDQYGRGNFSSGPTEGPVFDWRAIEAAQNAGKV